MQDNGKLRVVCTLFPYYDFVRQIGGDDVDVTLVVPAGRETHSFEPTPLDVIRISEADVFVHDISLLDTAAERSFSVAQETPEVSPAPEDLLLYRLCPRLTSCRPVYARLSGIRRRNGSGSAAKYRGCRGGGKFSLTAGAFAPIIERLTGCSAVGSALGSGPRGRGFKSPHSDHKTGTTSSRACFALKISPIFRLL